MNNIFLSIKNDRMRRQSGAALLLFVIFFTVGLSAFAVTFSQLLVSDIRTWRQAAAVMAVEQSADAGAEDMAYRYMTGLTPDASETIYVGTTPVTTTSVYDGASSQFVVTATSTLSQAVRTSQLLLQVGFGASFNFGVQTGTGGFEMSNGSSVRGNVFSNGTIRKVGGGTATIYGDVISAGPGGAIDDITATGTARARTITDSSIEKDAYAYTLDGGIVEGDAYIFERVGGAVVVGNVYDHQPEESPADLPIPDSQIDAMKQDIVDTGTTIAVTDPECSSGEYFTDTDITLGFVKIECDLRIKKKGAATVLTLDGPIWVEGDITFEGGPDVEIDSSITNQTIAIIADNTNDRITSSRITVENGTTFTGSGSDTSYVLLISQNEDAETGGVAQDAIFMGQSSTGDVLVYAGHGRINLSNSVSLKEVTGYLIQLNNSAEVIYESGMVNLLFTSGPGGGFSVLGWQDVD